MTLGDADRSSFDALLADVIERDLPAGLSSMLDEVPVIVEDRPGDRLVAELREELGEPDLEADELCGLHSGPMLTERSIEEPAGVPEHILLFRVGIMALAAESGTGLREQIRITLLHEIGHHFGLDEDDLSELGYE